MFVFVFKVTCPDPELTNATVILTNTQNGPYVNGSWIIFNCDTGYTPTGDRISFCKGSGNWDPIDPICTGQNLIQDILPLCLPFIC